MNWRSWIWKVCKHSSNLQKSHSNTHFTSNSCNCCTSKLKSFFFQIQTWIGVDEIDPCDFGWSIVNEKLMPIKTAKQSARTALIAIIRCKCKSNCNTRRYSCRKRGLNCNISYGECHGQWCMNLKAIWWNKISWLIFTHLLFLLLAGNYN